MHEYELPEMFLKHLMLRQRIEDVRDGRRKTMQRNTNPQGIAGIERISRRDSSCDYCRRHWRRGLTKVTYAPTSPNTRWLIECGGFEDHPFGPSPNPRGEYQQHHKLPTKPLARLSDRVQTICETVKTMKWPPLQAHTNRIIRARSKAMSALKRAERERRLLESKANAKVGTIAHIGHGGLNLIALITELKRL